MSKPIKISHCWESSCRGIATQWAAGRLGASCHKVKGLSKIKDKAGRGIPASLMFRVFSLISGHTPQQFLHLKAMNKEKHEQSLEPLKCSGEFWVIRVNAELHFLSKWLPGAQKNNMLLALTSPLWENVDVKIPTKRRADWIQKCI